MNPRMPRFAYDASWPGLLRIAAWTALFVWLAGTLAPPLKHELQPKKGETAEARLVATIAEDPRYINTLPRAPGFNIQWVMDSTAGIFIPHPEVPQTSIGYKLIPAVVVEELKAAVPDEKFTFDVSVRPYLGGVEFYSAAAAAIAARPDMIVMSVSPFNLLDSHEIVQRTAHLSRASALWARHPQSWAWMPFIPSPANHLWALLGQHFTAIRDSSVHKGAIDALVFNMRIRPPALQVIRFPEGVGRNLIFWICEGILKTGCPDYIYSGGKTQDMQLWYREKLKIADLDGKGLSRSAWNKSLEILHESGLPVFIYQIPTGNILQDKLAYDNLARFNQILEADAEKYKNTNVHIVSQVTKDVIDTVKFRYNDNEHLSEGGRFPAYLGQQIWHILQQHRRDKNRTED